MHFESNERLHAYIDYLRTVDVAYFAETNRRKGLSKDVFLQISTAISLAFTVNEFEQLKQTLSDYLAGTSTFIQSTSAFQALCLN